MTRGLRVLVVDDERPAREEIGWMLARDPRIGSVRTAASASEALRALQEEDVDVVFSDIRMPGLSGIDLAQVLGRFRDPPRVVFVTAHDDHAVEAFDLDVADYLLKPLRESRLAEAVRRVADTGTGTGTGTGTAVPDDAIAVEQGGVTRFVRRSEVRYVEAHGDYARLHTAGGSPLVRTALSTLEEQWRSAGFVRIHRSLLVALAHVTEVRSEGGRVSVVVGGEELGVARRHTRELRDLLVRRARPGAGP